MTRSAASTVLVAHGLTGVYSLWTRLDSSALQRGRAGATDMSAAAMMTGVRSAFGRPIELSLCQDRSKLHPEI